MAKKKKTEEDVTPVSGPGYIKKTVLLEDQARTHRPSLFNIRRKCCGA